MGQLETLSTAESPRKRIDDLLKRAETVLGFDDLPFDFDSEEWNEKKANKRIEETMRKVQLPENERVGSNRLRLADIFMANIDQSRLRVLGILESKGFEVSGDNVALNSLERRLVVGSQAEVSMMELAILSFQRYVSLVRKYREGQSVYRLNPSIKQQEAIADQFSSVMDFAGQRISLAYDYIDSAGNQKERERIKAKFLQAEKDIVTILASEDVGGKKDLPLPYVATIDAIEERYTKGYEDIRLLQNKESTERMSNIKTSIEEAEEKIIIEYNKDREERVSSTEEVPEGEAEKILGEKEFQKFQINRVMLSQATKSARQKIIDLQKRNAELLTLLSEINKEVGLYELHRSRLATIRHHFDQAYETSKTTFGRFMDLPLSDRQIEASAVFLQQEQLKSVSQLSDHIDFVDEKVLNIGAKEELEKMWNEDGRLYIGFLADILVSFETALIPGDRLKGLGKDTIMKGIYDSLGWPRNSAGNPLDWSELTEEDKGRMREKQKSTLTAINKFRGLNPDGKERIAEDPVANLQGSLDAAQKLINNQERYLSGEKSLEFKEIPNSELIKEPITDVYLDELIAEHGVQVVAASLFHQLNTEWEQYSNKYGTFLQEVHEVVGVHIEWARLMKEFARLQRNIAVLIAMVAGIAIAAGGFALTTAVFTARKIPKIASRMGRGLRIVSKSGRTFGFVALAGVTTAEVSIAYSITPSNDTKMTGQAVDLLDEILKSGKSLRYRNFLNPFASGMLEVDKKDVDYFKDALEKRQEVLYMRDALLVLKNDSADSNLRKRVADMLIKLARYDKEFTYRFPLKKGILGESPIVADTVMRDEFVKVYMDGLERKKKDKYAQRYSWMRQLEKENNLTDYDDLLLLREEFLNILRQAGVLTDIPEL
ncbi:MAG: hypothetical protein KAS32_16115 [Candidatus Peribacteraceae bacterium]|nr:hypothetical protein [Candidatus Peribacteraceae bacterium]